MPGPPQRVRYRYALVPSAAALGLAVIALTARPAMRQPRVGRAPGARGRRKSTTSIATGRSRPSARRSPPIRRTPAAYRGLASALWLSITFRRGNMTVDDYLGRVNRTERRCRRRRRRRPPRRFATRSIERWRSPASASRPTRATPTPTTSSAPRSACARPTSRRSTAAPSGPFAPRARRTRNTNRCSQLDPHRKDAGLIVGTYRYIVSALALPLRWVAYMAGFGGGQGTRAAHDRRSGRVPRRQPDGRALRAGPALQPRAAVRRARWSSWPSCASSFRETVWCGSETGATSLRAGRPADAERFLAEGLREFAQR